MSRFYVEAPHRMGDEIEISGAEAKHIQTVLRLREGDEIVLFDGKGMEYWGTIESQRLHRITVKIRKTGSPRRESPIEVILGQGILKGNKMDYVLQKTTEMGVSAIFPFVSSRTIPKLGGEGGERRWNRWKRIVLESAKQCGRTVPPRVEGIHNLGSILEWPFRGFVKLILWEKEARSLKERVREIDKISGKFLFLVGPEGGFCEEEISVAEGKGFIPVGLGPRILRSETAGVAMLSILQYEFGDWGLHQHRPCRGDSAKVFLV
ncbi:MAG: 16S rRNA (uracil(1498)-N(3))-methyltransferase [Syntrophobacterales bacterium]|nr:MAG: 16S rRNA (uracil(1498)-N(3))-methyltransferase [Syntrophobacterales bacterium]